MDVRSTPKSKPLYAIVLNEPCKHWDSQPWSLPDGDKPGNWHHSRPGPLVDYKNGRLLTTNPLYHWKSGARCYLAEAGGEIRLRGNARYLVAHARLVRPLTVEELAVFHVYVAGAHEITSHAFAIDCDRSNQDYIRYVAIAGDAKAKLRGTVHFRAFDRAEVEAFDDTDGIAYDEVTLRLNSAARAVCLSQVQARCWDRSQIEVRGTGSAMLFDMASGYFYDKSHGCSLQRSHMLLHDEASGEAMGGSLVRALGKNRIKAGDAAIVEANEHSIVEAGAKSLVNTRTGAKAQVSVSQFAQWLDWAGSKQPVITRAQ